MVNPPFKDYNTRNEAGTTREINNFRKKRKRKLLLKVEKKEN